MICAALGCNAQPTHRLRVRLATGREIDQRVCKPCGDRLLESYRDNAKPESLSSSLHELPATAGRRAA